MQHRHCAGRRECIDVYQIHVYLNSESTVLYTKIHISGNSGVHDRVFVYTVAASLQTSSALAVIIKYAGHAGHVRQDLSNVRQRPSVKFN